MTPPVTAQQFIAKWRRVELSERAASQEHFLDICHLLGQPTPAGHDATGADYAFEKGVAVTGEASRGSAGERGFADVWWRGKFGWEYKRRGKYRNLDEAYRQLCQYREALDNPPLLIVSDIAHTEIHTNFTGTRKEIHRFALEDFGRPDSLRKLRLVFENPEALRPELTTQRVTEQVAEQFGRLAKWLGERGHEPHDAAHFLMKCMFCLFAEDVDLLPGRIFEKILRQHAGDTDKLAARMADLFGKMRDGGFFGADEIAYFNGGLFKDATALKLTPDEVDILRQAAEHDWGAVEPAVFGTLFERSLDPSKRAQIGAHYTSREDIMLVVEPVVMAPLRREWAAVKEKIGGLIERRQKATTKAAKAIADKAIRAELQGFQHHLSALRILDPACGSGNFLYVAIQQLLDLEKEVITYAAAPEIAEGLLPRVRPTQLHGIEINAYAAELAQVVIWIGFLQWMRDNGFVAPRNPVLEPIQTIENRDAILDLSNPALPVPAQWPEADFIIGNPPFLGAKQLRGGLGEKYVEVLYGLYDDRIPRFSDLCCYWFEMAREHIERFAATRVGLLATQAIRNETARPVLERIKTTGDIFFAISDRQWMLDGASVHVAMIGFDGGTELEKSLDGDGVSSINADLTSGEDLTTACSLGPNMGIAFIGTQKSGPFDLNWEEARRMLIRPNPLGDGNEQVMRPTVNGLDLMRRARGEWIISFSGELSKERAAAFEAPFEHCAKVVRPERTAKHFAEFPYWQLWRAREPMQRAISSANRFLATAILTKHRAFTWLARPTLPDHQVVAFARGDDYFFGVLHSSIHELWARRMGTQLREAESGFRYTPTSCFETFALPWPPGKEPTKDAAYKRIAAAAEALNAQRERWLNPPEWIEPLARAIDAEDAFADVPEAARGLIRQSAIMARAAEHPMLRKRTLTNLYNERPTWLRIAHRELDEAVLAAYAAVDAEGGWSETWAEVWEETGAGFPLPAGHALAARRAEIDQRVLANLLRMNQERAGRVRPLREAGRKKSGKAKVGAKRASGRTRK